MKDLGYNNDGVIDYSHDIERAGPRQQEKMKNEEEKEEATLFTNDTNLDDIDDEIELSGI